MTTVKKIALVTGAKASARRLFAIWPVLAAPCCWARATRSEGRKLCGNCSGQDSTMFTFLRST